MLIVGSLKDADDLVTFLALVTEIFSEVPVFLNLTRETAHLLVPQTVLRSERVKMINGSHNPILHVDFSSMNDYMEDNETNSSLGERNSLGCVQILIPQELFLALGLISLVENILVVMAIIKNRNLHSPMYYFICCLAVSDMLVSVSNVVETIFMLLNDHGLLDVHPGMLRHLDNIIDVMICSSVVSSLSFLCTIAADRYITIFYALRYHSIMTTQRATAIIVVVWLASITSSILFIVYHTDNAVIVCLVTFFCTTLVFNAVLYLHMFLLAHVHSRRIVAFNKSRRQSTSMKGAITLTILLGVFIVCWGPFFLHLILILTCPTSPFCNCFFRNFNLFLILIICNSLIDPLIYAYRSQELRKTLQELILCSWCFGV